MQALKVLRLAVLAVGGMVAGSQAQATVLYALDSNSALWKLDTTGNGGAGIWTSYTGTGLSWAHGIDVDSQGNLYVANTGTYGASAISKVTLSGSTYSASNVAGRISITGPRDIAIAGSYLYVSDSGNKQVVRSALDGSGAVVIASGFGSQPQAIVANGSDVFVNVGSSVYRIANAASDTPVTMADYLTASSNLGGLTTDGTNLYATSGASLYGGTTSLVKLAGLPNSYASGPALVYADGEIFVADNGGGGGKIWEYSSSGTLLKTFTPTGAGPQFYGIAAAVPEPAMVGILGLAAASVLGGRRRRA